MRVTFAYLTEVDGRSHKPDSTADLPDPIARRLLREGRVRKASPTKSADSGDEKKEG